MTVGLLVNIDVDDLAAATRFYCAAFMLRVGRRLGAGGVAPLAVLPACQRRGIGAALMRDAIGQARARGAAGLVLLGEPAYCRRFGFRPTREFGLRCRWPGTEEALMAPELRPGGLAMAAGLARYHEAFDSLD